MSARDAKNGMSLEKRVIVDYTNHRGERRERTIDPIFFAFTSSPWHPEPQWILDAIDVERNETRSFALSGIHGWRPAPEELADG